VKIILYGINYSPELTGIGKYTGEMAVWLAESGHEVNVITAPPYYPEWKIKEGYKRKWYIKTIEDEVQVIRCPIYVPKLPSTLKRILHLTSFALSSFFPLLCKVSWKPDVIILIVPTLFCSLSALLIGMLTNAKTVIHIQDYEVDALFGLGMANNNFIRSLTFTIEKSLLSAFDKVSTISHGMMNKATTKGVSKDKLIFFPNWSETERFQEAVRSVEFLKSLNIPQDKKIILYSGNIGEKQGLEIIIDVAKTMQQDTNIIFLIVGEGAGKARLVNKAQIENLGNILFLPLQPNENLPSLLASADTHLVIQKCGAADAVLPSKLTNILAVGGNAIITADADTSLGLLCSEHPGIAVLVKPESISAIIEGIEKALQLPRRNQIAINYAKKFLDKKIILNSFICEINESK
jgi:colanic acid biosynthesis glycosyl transferase WcaI